MSKFSRIVCAAAAIALTGFGATLNAAVLFDNATAFTSTPATASATGTGSTPNTFMGFGANLVAGSSTITGFDLYPVNFTTTTFTNLRGTVYVWDTVNTGTVAAATPAFSTLLGTYSFNSAAGSFTPNTYFPFTSATAGEPGIAITTPLSVADSQIGLTFAYQGSTDGGLTYSAVNSLTSIITYGAAPTVGTSVFDGYYRNANSEVNGNFTSTLRSLGQTNQMMAVRVYGTVGAVPEPTAAVALAPAALLLGRRRRA